MPLVEGAPSEADSLSRASWLGDLNSLRAHCAAGIDLNSSNALLLAAGYGRLPAVQLLLDSQADPNASRSGETPLMRAARFGRTACVRALLEAGGSAVVLDRNGWSALDHAAARGFAPTAALLCELAAPGSGQLGSALVSSAQYGHDDCVRVLLEAGAEVNQLAGGRAALVTAAEWGHSRIVGCLLVWPWLVRSCS